MYDQTIKNYLTRIGSIPVMDHGTLVECFKNLEELDKQFEEGRDTSNRIRREKIRNHITVSNLKLVVSIAKQYKTSDELPLIDLIQEGNIGLMKAIERFDYKKGYKFSTYATCWIRQSISIHVTKHRRTVRLPSHVVGVQRRIMEAIERHNEETGQTPTLEELKVILSDVSETVLEATLHAGMGTVSIHNTGRNTERSASAQQSLTLENKLEDESDGPYELFNQAEMLETISSVMNNLSVREAAVIRMRFGLYDAGVNRSEFIESKNENDEK